MQKIEHSGLKSDPVAKSDRQIRIHYSDMEEQNSDPFMRHWIILKNLGKIRLGSDFEGHLAKNFIDTGANCNTITRQFYSTLVGQGLNCAFYPGPSGVSENLMENFSF